MRRFAARGSLAGNSSIFHLERIAAYDQTTKLNSLLCINSAARTRADELDRLFAQTGTLLPLHGIPVIVKDNYDTFDLPTTAGSLALAGSTPPDDAYQVRRLREAGAVVLAKSNMAEFAHSPNYTISSLGGTTRNPYDLERVPAGSSGGTAAAIAASFGVIGLGTRHGQLDSRSLVAHFACRTPADTWPDESRRNCSLVPPQRYRRGPCAERWQSVARVLDRHRRPRSGRSDHCEIDRQNSWLLRVIASRRAAGCPNRCAHHTIRHGRSRRRR